VHCHENNSVADALLRLLDPIPPAMAINTIFGIESNPKLFGKIWKGYTHDSWCTRILDDMKQNVTDLKLGFALKNGLLFVGNRLIIPKYEDLCEQLF
jgi:hypothetical protein